MRLRIRAHLTGSLLALVAGACGSPPARRAAPSSREHRAFTDDAGRQVVVAVPARRIVSLAPSITELLFALGAGRHVVGRTTWCRYPPAALTVPVVGDGLNPDVEVVAARRPDLVLLYRSSLTDIAAAQLQGLGIPAVILRHDRIEDVSRTARLLGVLTGRAPAGDSIAQQLDHLLATGPPPPGARPRPRVALVVWDTPPIVIGGGSYLNELMTLAGGRNVFGDGPAASITVSLEAIAARDPDWIAVIGDQAARPPAWARRPEWQAVRAVRDGRFLYLPPALFGQPSPRAALAVAALRRRLGTGP